MRSVKSPWELERMRVAAGQVRDAAHAIPGLLSEGHGRV